MRPEHLLVERDGPVVVATINRPEVLNALNERVLAGLSTVLDDVLADEAARVLVLTGAGDRAFAAGADIRELGGRTAVGSRDHARRGQELFDRIERAPKPVIAAVNGFALGGGCELAMACALRLAAETATFGQPEINLGLLPGYAGSQRLPRLVGRGRALEILLTGDAISAEEAWRIGLVNRVVPAAALMTETHRVARAIAAKPAVAVRCILEAVAAGLAMPFAEAQDYEATLFGLVSTTEDMREGTQAFLEKRKPQFKGR
jgi:enoyl-CoA hydratase